jgi:hypothetical protein
MPARSEIKNNCVMYPYSSQKKNWTFSSEQELIQLRMKANQDFINVHGAGLDVSFEFCLQFKT